VFTRNGRKVDEVSSKEEGEESYPGATIREKPKTKVPVLKLTPELKEQALKGMPLFADSGKLGAPVAGAESNHKKKEIPREVPEVDDEDEVRQRAAGGRVDAKAIDHNPSEAQKAAGNYAKDHVNIHGLSISIENAKGSKRSGIGSDGKPWNSVLPAHYGYLKRSEGADGDHVDLYLGPHLKSSKVYIIDQLNAETKGFDEHKAFIGFGSQQQVIGVYHKAFSDGKAVHRLGAIHEMSIEGFKDWLETGDTKAPISDGGIAPTKTPDKIDRSAFLYMEPKPPLNKFAQCGTCFMFTGNRCMILGPKIEITPAMSCALYVHGTPRLDQAGKEKALVTPNEAGLLNAKVRCENCQYGGEDCSLFKMLNQRLPETFNLETKINAKGCCNAFSQR
jgi:hypothetical protein